MIKERPNSSIGNTGLETVLDELADSQVSVVGDGEQRFIKKLYTGAFKTLQNDGFGADTLRRYLEIYIQDCQYIHQQENEKPELFSFTLSNGAQINFHFVPQGSTLEKDGDMYATLGQEYIDGNNLRDDLGMENISSAIYQIEPEIRKLLIDLSNRINDLFPIRSRSYTVTEPNIKIKFHDGAFHAYVTDLADSLIRSISPEVVWPKQ